MISRDAGLNSTDCKRVMVDYYKNGYCLPLPQTTGAGGNGSDQKVLGSSFPFPSPR